MTRVSLYRIIGNDLVLIDYGVESMVDSYTKQGYIVLTERKVYS